MKTKKRPRLPLYLAAWLALLLGPVWAQPVSFQVSGEIVYTASFPLGTWQGRNTAVYGEVSWDGRREQLEGTVCVDLAAWDSGNALRDADTRAMFEVDRYPEACYELSGYVGEAGGPVTLVGTLSLHGVERELRISGTVSAREGGFVFSGRFSTALSVWNIAPPRVLFLVVDDAVEVEVGGVAVAERPPRRVLYSLGLVVHSLTGALKACYDTLPCRDGGTGRRSRLKIYRA
jgi:polyisoprenoid-binding protein YceI